MFSLALQSVKGSLWSMASARSLATVQRAVIIPGGPRNSGLGAVIKAKKINTPGCVNK